jgi:hypothetical protein
MKKVKEIVNSWWFQSALTGAAGLALLSYGYPMYAGVAFGWALCKVFGYIRS